MNNHFNDEAQGKLIHRALADENWNTFDAQLRREALQTFVAAKRRRRFAFLTAQAAIFIVAGALASVLLRHSQSKPAFHSTLANDVEKADPALPNAITEQQMLAMFPPGSCLVAEINGEKQLVFLDSKIARDGFPLE